MYIATKKNRQVRIYDKSMLKAYEEKGYTIKNEKGVIVFEPEDPVKEIEALKAENESLRAEIAKLKEEKPSGRKKSTGIESAE